MIQKNIDRSIITYNTILQSCKDKRYCKLYDILYKIYLLKHFYIIVN
jgi:hypothetical protein